MRPTAHVPLTQNRLKTSDEITCGDCIDIWSRDRNLFLYIAVGTLLLIFFKKMEIHSVIIENGLQKLKEDTVQNIFSESVEEEIRSANSPELISGLSTPHGNLSELTDNLILTSASNVNQQTLESNSISCIISCAPELPESPLHDDVIYHKIEVIDSGCSRILHHFDPAADLIHQVSSLGGKTLVYCVAGVSRSASICLAYLMKYQRLSLLEAYNYVKLRRPRIRPNCGFFKQLIEYEKQLFGCNTVQMVFNEFVQMEIPDVYDCDYKVPTSYSKKRSKNGRAAKELDKLKKSDLIEIILNRKVPSECKMSQKVKLLIEGDFDYFCYSNAILPPKSSTGQHNLLTLQRNRTKRNTENEKCSKLLAGSSKQPRVMQEKETVPKMNKKVDTQMLSEAVHEAETHNLCDKYMPYET
ncbi:hypothetical protein JTB14_007961 [Gonioctena quinquepunctata]|nr:hypothetical protein JTB14_007961 [Gonioctena quinquepunctata]